MNKNSLIKDLEDYKYDYQYYQERSKDIEKLKLEIDKQYYYLNDMQIKRYDTSELELKIKDIVQSLKYKEKCLLNTITKKERLEHNIENMPQPFKNILFLKYIKNYSVEQIAIKMSYSSKRIYQLHKEAIKIYCEKYGVND